MHPINRAKGELIGEHQATRGLHEPLRSFNYYEPQPVSIAWVRDLAATASILMHRADVLCPLCMDKNMDLKPNLPWYTRRRFE